MKTTLILLALVSAGAVGIWIWSVKHARKHTKHSKGEKTYEEEKKKIHLDAVADVADSSLDDLVREYNTRSHGGDRGPG